MNLPLNIDLQQIFLHMLNFVILAGGLYFILYSPVKKFMDQRAARYAEMDAAAAQKLAEAEKLAAGHQAQLDKLEDARRSPRPPPSSSWTAPSSRRTRSSPPPARTPRASAPRP